ncbi:peptidase inhibitor 16-like [Sycon ciliatum]|uniref:peptidase inhibitor 16-like n=1 Tax=Sycon ciliatum TaxID=27933 RepID=UPI0031F68AEB
MGLATVLVGLAVCAVLPRCAQSVFTQSQKDAMLNAHNNARSIASPTPCTPLPAMTWNTVLANVAQAYADRCIYEHNGARTSDTNGAFSYVGENLYISTNTPSDPAVSVTSWDSEKEDYDYDTLTCAPGKVCGHYTQIVWNSSQQLGCGAKLCDAANTKSYPFDKSKFSKGYIVVCNYGPGGNYRGQKAYTTCADSAAGMPQPHTWLVTTVLLLMLCLLKHM